MTFVASGDASDFSSSVQQNFKLALAAVVGSVTSRIYLSIQSASVAIVATILTPTEGEAQAMQQQLSNMTISELDSALGITILEQITVAYGITGADDATSSKGVPYDIIGGVIGGTIALAIVLRLTVCRPSGSSNSRLLEITPKASTAKAVPSPEEGRVALGYQMGLTEHL